MAGQPLLAVALLLLFVWMGAALVALACLLGIRPIRQGGPAAMLLGAGTALIPAVVLAALLVTARVSSLADAPASSPSTATVVSSLPAALR